MERKQLSRRQTEIFKYIKLFTSENGYPPTVREIGEHVHLKSPATVSRHIETLELKGYLMRDPAKPRALTIIDDEFDLLDIAAKVEKFASKHNCKHEEVFDKEKEYL